MGACQEQGPATGRVGCDPGPGRECKREEAGLGQQSENGRHQGEGLGNPTRGFQISGEDLQACEWRLEGLWE